MENTEEEQALNERKILKDRISALLGRAPSSIMSRFRTAQIFYGLTSLSQIRGFLEPKLEKEERRVLIITDDFTEKFAGQIIEVLNSMGAESKVWSGVKPEGPLYTIEEAAKICEEFKPTVFIAVGGGSVMDSAKVIMIKYEKPETNLRRISPFGSLGLRKKVKYFP